MNVLARSWWLACVVVSAGVAARGAEPAPDAAAEKPKVSYFRDIRPILQDRCQGCHQPAKKMGGILMTGVEEMQKGGESETPAFVAGKPDDSLLVSLISLGKDGKAAMPVNADPLPQLQIDLIRRWVSEGGVDDTPESSKIVVDMDHPPVYAAEPVVTSVDYSPNGELLAVSGYHEVLLHKADGSGIVARLVGMSERIESAVFSPDGESLAVTGGSPGRFGEVQIWDVAKRKLRISYPVTYDTVYGASWSTDSGRVAFGGADNVVRAIDAKTGKQVLQQGAHADWVRDTAFSSDNSHLVSVGRDMTMKLTEVATERFIDNITSITPGALKGGLMAVDRHPTKDELLIGGADGIPKIYKMYRTQDRKIGDDFNKIRAFDPLPGRIFDGRYNADGSRIVVGSSDNGHGEIRVYQANDGKLVSKFDYDGGPVYSTAYRPDGKAVAVGGFDGLVRLYDPDTGKLIKSFPAAPLESQVARP